MRNKRKNDPEFRRKENIKHYQWYKNQRVILVKSLGGRCVCIRNNCWHIESPCNLTDIRILHLDHINGGGKKDFSRFSNEREAYRYYNNHLDEAKRVLQVHCSNCNWVKRIENKEDFQSKNVI